MPKRPHIFCNNYYYHILNRGINRQTIFRDQNDYQRFYQALFYYRFQNLPLKLSDYIRQKEERKTAMTQALFVSERQRVSIISFALMPNHFHLLLEQLQDEGVHDFIHEIADSYTRYFNVKYDLIGPLFQGRFKSIPVQDDNQLFHLSRYIHLNPVTSGYINKEDLSSYSWTSYKEYVRGGLGICNKDLLLSNFSDTCDFTQFLLDNVAYQKTLHLMKKISLE